MKEFLQYLLARAAMVPGITETRIYNDQITKLNEDLQANFPIILVEVERVEYLQLPNSYQTANVEVKLHIVHSSPLQGEEFDIYDLKEKVQRYMNRFSAGGILIEMVRTEEVLDRNHDMLYDYVISYYTQFRDYTPPLEDDVPVEIEILKIRTDLDIDNIVMRTGDNKNYNF